MDAPPNPLVEILLTTGRTLALQMNERLSVRVIHNAPLLVEWRGDNEEMPGSLHLLLEELLPLMHADAVMRQIEAAAASTEEAAVTLGTVQLRPPPGGGPDRHVALSLHHTAEVQGLPLLLLLRDVTATEGLRQALTNSRQSLATALTALRSSPQAIRLFLPAAMTSVGALRATMKLPARDQEAVHAKLVRLKEEADRLEADALENSLATVAEACAAFSQHVARLHERPVLTGDDLLPLAPRLDQIASAVGDTIRIEEQRYVPQVRSRAGAARATTSPEERKEAEAWARGAEKRWNSFLRRRGEELGVLAKLQVHGARLVPAALRRDIDDLLQHLLRNAMEHGIETPEQRLAAGKSAAGEISLRFEDRDRHGLTMTVRDDGRGFDIERIGRAAVLSGLISEESLLEHDPGEVVGLIFKPPFSTEHLEGEAGRGRGMSFLRRTVTRLGGQITVATKPGSYTRFVIQLPAHAAVAATGRYVSSSQP